MAQKSIPRRLSKKSQMNKRARSRLLSVPVLYLWFAVLSGCQPEAVSIQDDLTAYMDQAPSMGSDRGEN